MWHVRARTERDAERGRWEMTSSWQLHVGRGNAGTGGLEASCEWLHLAEGQVEGRIHGTEFAFVKNCFLS